MKEYPNRMVYCKSCCNLFFTFRVPKECPAFECDGIPIDVTDNPKYTARVPNSMVAIEAEEEINKIFKSANRFPNGELIDTSISVENNSGDPLTVAAMEAKNDFI